MNILNIISFTLCVLVCLSVQDDDHSNRVFDKVGSDKEHFDDGQHNSDFDHDSFLGRDQAKEFDDLPLEESKRRLGLIFDKIDVDGSLTLSETELKQWIVLVQNQYVAEDTKKQWTTNDYGNADSLLSWSDYLAKHYGEPSERDADIKKIVERDQRKWKLADVNSDGKLSMKEMESFLHPEEAKHMQNNVVAETLEDMDKNDDGKIDVDEFINDMWTKSEENESPPEWVESERESFKESRDKNNDGFMDAEELKEWVLPEDFDHSNSEAKHLIDEVDNNKDGVLSKEEVMEHHSVFAGNHVTDYGELLRHDEL